MMARQEQAQQQQTEGPTQEKESRQSQRTLKTESVTDDTGACPDWSAISEQILCPRCGYDLRGLERARCPECGLTIHWPQLIDPASRAHPYLYEHHDGKKRIRRYFKTIWRGLWPPTFWSELQLQHRSEPKRLVAFLLITVILVVVLPLVADLSITALQILASSRRGAPVSFTLNDVLAIAWYHLQVSIPLVGWWLPGTRPAAYFMGWYIALPVASVSVLFVYWLSRKRFRLLPHHLWRSGIYAWASTAIWLYMLPKLIWSATLVVIMAWEMLTPSPTMTRFGPMGNPWSMFLTLVSSPQVLIYWGIVLLICFWISLWIAGRRYLRLKGGWTVALVAAQTILILAFCLITVLHALTRDRFRLIEPVLNGVGWSTGY